MREFAQIVTMLPTYELQLYYCKENLTTTINDLSISSILLASWFFFGELSSPMIPHSY